MFIDGFKNAGFVNAAKKAYSGALPIVRTLWLLILLSPLAYAEVFKWQDSQGKTHYSDQPHNGSRIIEVKPGYAFHGIKYVYDGDTILLENGQKIRLLGINSPEVDGRYKAAEPGGDDARAWLENLLSGKKVRLVTDRKKKDKYGRILAHIFTEDNVHVNVELVRRGLAAVSIYPPNLKYEKNLVNAQQQAEAGRAGIWNMNEYQPQPVESILAGRHRGWKRLTGEVKRFRDTRKYLYLEFSDQVDARIDRRYLDLFPDVSRYKAKVEIRGWPTKRKGHYSIYLRHPADIKLIQ